MSKRLVTRRIFVRDTAVMAAGVAAGVSLAAAPRRIVAAGATDVPAEVKSTRNYNPNMEYRRLGKTGLWVSAVCLGGHWKRVDKVIKLAGAMDPYRGSGNSADMESLRKNRDEVISRCIEVGINCIDFAGDAEPETYCSVLKDRRDKFYLAYSHPASELRVPENRTAKRLVELFEAGLKRCHLEYADTWRLMALERGGSHSPADVEAMVEAAGHGAQERSVPIHRFLHSRSQVGQDADRDLSGRDADAVYALHGQHQSPAAGQPVRGHRSSTMSACWASSRLPATRSSRAMARRTARTSKKTTAAPGWPSATSWATPRSPRRFPA